MTDVLDFLMYAPDQSPTSFVVERPTPEPITARFAATPLLRGTMRRGAAKHVFREIAIPARHYEIVPDDVLKHPGTVALDDLREWLELSLDALVRLVGLAPSTRQWWRNHPDAPLRPEKAGRLMRFHMAVGLLVGALGIPGARHLMQIEGWLTEPLDDARLREFEARVRGVLRPEGLRLPTHLAGGMTSNQHGATVDIEAELDQQQRERARPLSDLGPEESP